LSLEDRELPLDKLCVCPDLGNLLFFLLGTLEALEELVPAEAELSMPRTVEK